MPQFPLLTISEYAQACRVDERTVYRWIEAGRVTAVRLSPRCVRVVPDETVALVFLTASSTTSTATT